MNLDIYLMWTLSGSVLFRFQCEAGQPVPPCRLRPLFGLISHPESSQQLLCTKSHLRNSEEHNYSCSHDYSIYWGAQQRISQPPHETTRQLAIPIQPTCQPLHIYHTVPEPLTYWSWYISRRRRRRRRRSRRPISRRATCTVQPHHPSHALEPNGAKKSPAVFPSQTEKTVVPSYCAFGVCWNPSLSCHPQWTPSRHDLKSAPLAGWQISHFWTDCLLGTVGPQCHILYYFSTTFRVTSWRVSFIG